MNNIEKLAIEHGATQYNGNIIFERAEHLETFAKAYASSLQSSEPVAKSMPICNLWVNPETFDYEVDRCTHPLNELVPVYTHPPASVSLEKYNKLLDALKKLDDFNNDLLESSVYVEQVISQAIAEAEGKEG